MYPEGYNVPHFEGENASLLLPPNKGSKDPNIGDFALPNKI